MKFGNEVLFSENVSLDIKETYEEYLEQGYQNEKAFICTYNSYKNLFGSGEEPLFWYAIADAQWEYGRLSENVKQKALSLIENNAGEELQKSTYGRREWRNALCELKEELCSEQPPEKDFCKSCIAEKAVWKIGDIYAYRFHTERAERNGLFGKYIMFQKVCNYVDEFNGAEFSVIRAYDKIFDSLPSGSVLPTLAKLDPLPLITREEAALFGEFGFAVTEQYINTVMYVKPDFEFPNDYLTFVESGKAEVPCSDISFGECDWGKDGIDDKLIDVYESRHGI